MVFIIQHGGAVVLQNRLVCLETGFLGEGLPHPQCVFTPTVHFAVRCPESRSQGTLHDGSSFFLLKLDHYRCETHVFREKKRHRGHRI